MGIEYNIRMGLDFKQLMAVQRGGHINPARAQKKVMIKPIRYEIIIFFLDDLKFIFSLIWSLL